MRPWKMRPSRSVVAVAGGTMAVGAFVLAAAFLSAPPVLGGPSPTPAPTPRPTVAVTTTPAPTVAPTPSPTPDITRRPTPQPTISYVAGGRLLPFYFEIRPLFPALPPTPVILPDEEAEVPENAVFSGLDAQGQPKFAVRHDFVMDKGTAAHEMGHAYQKVMERRDPSRDVLALYWAFRGFPGTWQQADANAASQPSYSAKWTLSPQESWAEAFRAAVTLEAKERTLDYGKAIDPLAARQFFLSLAK